MFLAALSFISAFIATMLTLRWSSHHRHGQDEVSGGIQKVHTRPTARIGGVGIFASCLLGAWADWIRISSLLMAGLLLCGSVALFAGLWEDITRRVSPSRRLCLIMLAASLAYFLLDASVQRIGIDVLDAWLASGDWIAHWLLFALSILLVSGLTNAVNIIDGFHGLASAVVMLMLCSVCYVAWQVGDTVLMRVCLITIGAIAGFFMWNYPNGLIFLGDGGAYFIGFMLAELVVLLVSHHPQVSPWYAVLLLIYPAFETLFAIYRRLLRGRSPSLPDGVHLHSLIFRRLVRWTLEGTKKQVLTRRNAMTSPYLWLLSSLAVIPATLFWQQQWLLIGFSVLFVVTYVALYGAIVKFKTPLFLRRR